MGRTSCKGAQASLRRDSGRRVPSPAEPASRKDRLSIEQKGSTKLSTARQWEGGDAVFCRDIAGKC